MWPTTGADISNTTCSVPGCELLVDTRGWCRTHYRRVNRKGDPGPVGTRHGDSVKAEQKFREQLEELGATLLEPGWLGANVPHRVRCANGHIASPYPGNMRRHRTGGVCVECSRINDPRSRNAESRFRRRLTELKAELLETEWVGTSHSYRVRCWCGYETNTWPSGILAGGGFCLACNGLDPKGAEARFLARLAKDGATPLEPYRTARLPVKTICAAGHECFPTQENLKRGGGVCSACSGCDPKEAHRRFLERVAALGGEVLDTGWLGSNTKHRVVCANGHHCSITPNNLDYSSLCKSCALRNPTVFYVVINRNRNRLKFGISSGNGSNRLGNHRKAGYETVVRLITEMDDSRTLESLVKSTLHDAGMEPIKGREYFDVSALALILDIVDNYTIGAAAVAA